MKYTVSIPIRTYGRSGGLKHPVYWQYPAIDADGVDAAIALFRARQYDEGAVLIAESQSIRSLLPEHRHWYDGSVVYEKL